MNSHFNTTGTHQPSFFRFKDKILLFAIAFCRAAFLLLFSSNGCWSGFKTDLIPVHLRQWGGQLLRARTLEVNKDALNVHEHQYSRSEVSHVSIVLFLLVFLQGLLLWSLALQLVRDWYVSFGVQPYTSPIIHFKHTHTGNTTPKDGIVSHCSVTPKNHAFKKPRDHVSAVCISTVCRI